MQISIIGNHWSQNTIFITYGLISIFYSINIIFNMFKFSLGITFWRIKIVI